MKSRPQKQEEGARRNEQWAALSPTEKLGVLNRRLGPGVGAKRQRRILEASMHKKG